MKRGAGHEPHMLRVRALYYVVLFGAYCVFFPFLQNAFKVSLSSPLKMFEFANAWRFLVPH